MTHTSISASICTDCLMIVANDDDSGIPNPTAHRAAMARESWEGYALLPGDGSSSFSWSRCDGCGEQISGDRHAAWWVSRA